MIIIIILTGIKNWCYSSIQTMSLWDWAAMSAWKSDAGFQSSGNDDVYLAERRSNIYV